MADSRNFVSDQAPAVDAHESLAYVVVRADGKVVTFLHAGIQDDRSKLELSTLISKGVLALHQIMDDPNHGLIHTLPISPSRN